MASCRLCRLAPLAAVAVAGAGCGSSAERPTQPETARARTAARVQPEQDAPTSTTAARGRRWRFRGKPVVVAFLRASVPGYTVLFRLNRALPRDGTVVVSLEGARDCDLSGTGYTDSTAGGCYVWGLTRVRRLPESLKRPNVADRLRVRVAIKARPATTLAASATPQAAVVADGEPGIASDDRLRRLGCPERGPSRPSGR